MIEKQQELEAKVDGLQLVLAMVMDMLPEDEVWERLHSLEDTARKQNMRPETIEVIQSLREKWDAAL